MHRNIQKTFTRPGAMLMAITAAFLFAAYQPVVQAKKEPPPEPGTHLVRLSISGMPPSKAIDIINTAASQNRFIVDSFFDISYEIVAVENLGSSGMDGVRASSFNVDSFFDITYEIEPGAGAGSWDTEIVSMSLRATLDPAQDPNGERLLRLLRTELLGRQQNPDRRPPPVFHGHVTILK